MMSIFAATNTLPMIYQNEAAECGFACLAMICNFYGKRSDLRTLREYLAIPGGGASVKQLLQLSEQLDLQARPLKLELSDLERITLPAILHWDTDHFVVLCRRTKRSIVIHDPAVGVRRYTLAELDLHFTGIAIELSPAFSFKKEDIARSFSIKELFRGAPVFGLAIWQVFILSLLIQLLALVSPLYLQLVIDQGLSKGDMDIVLLVALLFTLVLLAKTFVNYFRGVLLLQFSNHLGFQLLSGAFSHLLSLPLAFFERREMGDIVSRFSSLDTIKKLVTHEMITVVVDGLFSILTLLLLFFYSTSMAVAALFFVTFTSVIRILALPREKALRHELLQTGAKQQTRFMENVRCIAVTKNYGIEADRLSDWQNHYANFVNSGYRLGKLELSLASVHSLLFSIDHIVTIYLGAGAIFSAQLTIGQLMSFIFLKQNFSGSISAMVPKLAEIKLLRLELDRVSDIVLAHPEQESVGNCLLEHRITGAMGVDRVCFHYEGERRNLLEDLSFRLDAGAFLVITGHSGCGKSTLLKLLIGLDVPCSGDVLIDDKPLSEIGLKIYRTQIAAVMHSESLLAGSIAYNINLGVDPLNVKRLHEVCQQTHILDDLQKLPMGLNTQVGEMGVALSAGQIQRVLLARALYRCPKILVLDEALSHLSIEVATRLIRNILQMKITLVLVTHSSELAGLAEFCLHLDSVAPPVFNSKSRVMDCEVQE